MIVTRGDAEADYKKLVEATPELRIGKLVGCRAVDYGTYTERLKASRKGKKSPAEMLADPDARAYLDAKALQLKQKLHSILGIYAGLVPSFRPLHAKYLCHRFNASSVLDFTAGWGGRMLGAVSLGCRYTGIDTNHDLKEGYERLHKITGGDVTMLWKPAETVDFATLDYDLVLTSTPFADLEIYRNQPSYSNWTNEFLIPVTTKAFASLKPGGWMALCIPQDLADAVSQSIGNHDETVPLPIRSRHKGQNVKHEIVYCWNKK